MKQLRVQKRQGCREVQQPCPQCDWDRSGTHKPPGLGTAFQLLSYGLRSLEEPLVHTAV